MNATNFENAIPGINKDSIHILREQEEKLTKAVKAVGARQAINNYIYANGKIDNGYLPCGETPEEVTDDIVRTCETYVKVRCTGLTDEDIIGTINDRAARYEKDEKIQYLASVVLAQKIFAGECGSLDEDSIRSSYNQILAHETNESQEDTLNRISAMIDPEKIRGCCELIESDDYIKELLDGSSESEERLRKMFDNFLTADQHAVNCAIVYCEITQGKVEQAASDLNPCLVSTAVCTLTDVEKVVEKEKKDEITHEEAELTLNVLETIFVCLVTLAIIVAVCFGLLIAGIYLAEALSTIPAVGSFLGVATIIVTTLAFMAAMIDITENDVVDEVYGFLEEIALIIKERFTIPCFEKLKAGASKAKSIFTSSDSVKTKPSSKVKNSKVAVEA